MVATALANDSLEHPTGNAAAYIHHDSNNNQVDMSPLGTNVTAVWEYGVCCCGLRIPSTQHTGSMEGAAD